jgi:Transposase DDE domain
MPEPTSFSREVVARLPLARAVLTTLAYLWRDDFLDGFFGRHAGRSYEREISFAHFLDLLRDALLQRQGSLAAALEHAETTVATRQAYYGKLRRMPLSLSAALLREAAERLRPLLPGPGPGALPDCLAGWEVRMLDGKKLKRVAKRLLSTRGAAGKLFGGKLLVSWDPRSELADAVAADPDGEVNECTLVPALLAELPEPTGGRPWLLVADRQFGDLVQPGRFGAAGFHFLVRQSAKTHFRPDPAAPDLRGRDAAGRAVVQRWGWLGSGPNRLYVRQVTLHRPDAEAVVLVTDLLEQEHFPAAALLAVYLRRWGIEQVFQRITEVFGLARFIGSSAEATVFQASYCLVLYDVIRVVQNYVAAAGSCAAEDVSTRKLFVDVHEELLSVCKLVPAAELVPLVNGAGTPADLVGRLGSLLRTSWRPRYRKARDNKPRPPRQRARQSGAHTSVYRLQQKHRASRKKEP